MTKELNVRRLATAALAAGTIVAVIHAAAGAAEPDLGMSARRSEPPVPAPKSAESGDYPAEEGSVLKTSTDAKTKAGKDKTGEYVAFVSGFALRQGAVVATVFRLYQNMSVTILAGFLLTDDDKRVSFSTDPLKGWRFPPGASFTLRKVKYAVDARGRLDPGGCGPVTLNDVAEYALLGEKGVAKYKRTSDAADMVKMTVDRQWAPEDGITVEVDGVLMRAKGGRLRKVPPKAQ